MLARPRIDDPLRKRIHGRRSWREFRAGRVVEPGTNHAVLVLKQANFYHGDTEAQRFDFNIAARRRFRVNRKTPSGVLLSCISLCLRVSVVNSSLE